jgi:hypothetical protein
MKKIYLGFIAFIFSVGVQAQPSLQWVKQTTGTSNNSAGQGVVTDQDGNVYTTGYFENTVDFDPGPGVFNLTSFGDSDAFILKQDAAGNFIWAKQLGGTLYDGAYSICVDALGNVITVGDFVGTSDFDPGMGTFNLTSSGGWDFYVSKLDASGNFVWAKKIGGTSNDRSYSVIVDDTGNIYTAGYFNSSVVDFDPGVAIFNLSNLGGLDAFILKLDAAGNFVWAQKISGTGAEVIKGISLDNSGNIYSTGSFSGTTDFNPGAGTFNLTSVVASTDAFILELDVAGNFVWAKQLGGNGFDEGAAIVVDNSGNILTSGRFNGSIDFDPGVGTFNLTSNGVQDAYISKLDATGNFIWAKSFGGSSAETGASIAIDSWDNVYCTGTFENTVDFDPGVGVFNLTCVGSKNTYVIKLDEPGDFQWAIQYGNLIGSNQGYGITTDTLDNVITTGYFNSVTDFDPGIGITNLTTTLATAYIHKMASCSVSPTTPSVISGTTTICSGSSNTYSVTAVAGATSYTWTLPSGWSGTSTTNTINATASATSGDVTVTANNACGSSTVQTLAITVNPIPSTPGTISGTTTICSGSSNTYSITAVAGATSYTWTLPSGWSGTSTTNSINTTASATSGDITVTANNACGNSTAATLAITVNDVPAMPSTITGSTSFCEDATAQTYSVTNDVSATSYTWTLPIGWSGTSTTNSINSTVATSGGTITVTANNGCGSSTAQSLVVTINSLPVVGLTLTTDLLCINAAQVSLSGGSPSGGTFSGAGVSAGNFNPTTAGAGTHVITYTYTDGNSCTNSATDNIVVDLCLGISSGSDLTNHFSVYPNPTNSLVTIETKNGQEKNVVIYNSMGQIVFTQLMMTDKLMIDMSAFNSGIYLIQLQSENGFSSEIIVKQ